MSHIPLRKEKDCLNCGTIVQGRYCQNCGQENVVPKESFLHMFTHFVFDIFHFDGKFFETVKDLLFKPGFLSKEYMRGKRASYLHPIKMYVFTSAVFFLLFFGFFSQGTLKVNNPSYDSGIQRLEELAKIEEKIRKDTVTVDDSLRARRLARVELLKDTLVPIKWEDVAFLGLNTLEINFSGEGMSYKTVEQYDSAQKLLPKKERDGWFRRRLIKKEISVNNKYRYNGEELVAKLADTVLHRLPYMLFLSLPLFALLLKFVYIRRKQFYYADHGVFTLHLYVFSFIVLFFFFCLDELQKLTGITDIDWIQGFLVLLLFLYLYKAMRKFYGQSRLKTFFKFLLVAILSLLMMVLLLAIFFFFTAFEL